MKVSSSLSVSFLTARIARTPDVCITCELDEAAAMALHHVRVAQRDGDALVGANDGLQPLHRVGVLQVFAIGVLGVRQDVEPHLVGHLHQLHEQRVARGRVGLCRDHVADGLVEDVDLSRLEVRDVRAQVDAELIDVRHRLTHLQDDELPPALLGDFEESVARHVLHARVQLVHELEELVDYRLQELPMGAQEARAHGRLEQRRVGLRRPLGNGQVLPEEAGEEEGQVLDEGLVVVGADRVGMRHVRVRQHHWWRLSAHPDEDGRGHFGEQCLWGRQLEQGESGERRKQEGC
eukprot:scaffold4841_cov121-Isochrysis_galbana.AAC.8